MDRFISLHLALHWIHILLGKGMCTSRNTFAHVYIHTRLRTLCNCIFHPVLHQGSVMTEPSVIRDYALLKKNKGNTRSSRITQSHYVKNRKPL